MKRVYNAFLMVFLFLSQMTGILKVLDSFTYQTTEIDVVQTELRCLLIHLPAQTGKYRYKLSLVHTS